MKSSIDVQLLSTLAPREWKVLLLLADEHRTPEIAEKLFLSKRSVETYQDHIRSKLNISGPGNLARFARLNNGILQEIHRKLYPPLKSKIDTKDSFLESAKCSSFTIYAAIVESILLHH